MDVLHASVSNMALSVCTLLSQQDSMFVATRLAVCCNIPTTNKLPSTTNIQSCCNKPDSCCDVSAYFTSHTEHRPGWQSSRAETEGVVYEPVESAEDVVVHLAEHVVHGAARVVDRDARAASDRGF